MKNKSSKRLTDAQLRTSVEAYQKHGSISKAAKALGIAHSTLSHRLDRAGYDRSNDNNKQNLPSAHPTEDWEESDSTARLNINTRERLTSIADIMEYASIDAGKWRPHNLKTKAYQGFYKDEQGVGHIVQMFSISASFTIIHPFDMEAQRRDFINDMQKHAPKYRKPTYTARGKTKEHILEVSVPDIHVGKLAWKDETGEHYNLDKARNLYSDAVDSLVGKASNAYGRFDKIIFPVGNDLLHVDSPTNTTTRGTPQDVACRHLKAYTEARKMVIEQIDKLREIAPVQVIVVPGNHDQTNTFFLGDAVECWYNNNKHVTVDNRPISRKYMTHGTVLLGWAHGDDEKHDSYESLMIREMPVEFAQATWCEMHTGHFHKRKVTKYIACDTHGGMIVRVIPSLSGTDAWHYRKGYVKGPKGAEAFVYSKSTFESMFNYTPQQDIYTQAEGNSK